MNDFGLRVGVDGESEFKKALKDLNQNMKTLGTEAKLVGSQFDSQDKSIEALTARNEVLNKQIAEQAKKVDLLKDALENSKKKYGENSAQAQQWQQKLNLAQAELNGMNRELDKNQKEITETTKAEKTGTTQNDKFAKSLKDTGDSATKSSTAMQKAGKAIKAVGTAVAGAVTAIASVATKMVAEASALGSALANMTTQAAAYADEVLTLSQVTGISTEKLQEYAYAAELVDVSVETLTGSMKKNLNSMRQAAKGTGDALAAYEKLGVSVLDSNGNFRDSETVYWELIDALGQIEDDTERDVLAMTLLGKSAQDLNPLIKAGAQRLNEYAKQAHQAGYVVGEEALSAFGEFDDQLQKLKTGATAAKNALGTILLPTLTKLSTDGVDMLGKFTNAVLDSNGDLGVLAESLGNMLPEAISKLKSYMPSVTEFFSTLARDVLPTLVTSIVTGLPEFLNTVFNAVFTDLPVYFKELGKTLVENLPILVAELTNLVQKLADWMTENFSPILTAVLEVADALADALVQNTPKLLKAVIQIILAVVDAIVDNIPLIIESLIDQIPMIIQALIESLPLIIEGLIKLTIGITRALPSIFASLGKGIKDLFTKGIPEVGKWLGEKITSFVQSDTVQKMIEVGKNIVNGIKEGVVKFASGLIDGVKNVVGNVVNGIKDFLGIHSPSRVFAGIGEYMGEGLEQGFTSTMKSAEKKIAESIPHSFDVDARVRNIDGSLATIGNGNVNIPSATQNEQIALLKQQNSLLQRILEKNQTIQIGDDVIGRANTRYTQSRGVVLNGGSYAY